MSQAKNRKADELRAEYDFSGGVRGKHHLAYKAGTNVVVLDPDVAKAFPDASSVNRALRLLLELARKPAPLASGQAWRPRYVRPAYLTPDGRVDQIYNDCGCHKF